MEARGRTSKLAARAESWVSLGRPQRGSGVPHRKTEITATGTSAGCGERAAGPAGVAREDGRASEPGRRDEGDADRGSAIPAVETRHSRGRCPRQSKDDAEAGDLLKIEHASFLKTKVTERDFKIFILYVD